MNMHRSLVAFFVFVAAVATVGPAGFADRDHNKDLNGIKGLDIDAQSAVFGSNYYTSTITKYTKPYAHPPALRLTNQLLNPGGISFGP